MKKIFNFALIAAMVCGLSLAATSCKDDDKNNGGNGNGEEQAEGVMDNAGRFWAVAANLVSPFDVTDDYENKTFEPTIGQPMDGQPTIRVVNTGSLEAAAARFADMTGADVNENTPSYTYEDEAVGRMVYTKTNDGQSLATVDVDIKQIPGLQRIVYKTQEQMGSNGNFAGTPYYSFADVISVKNPGEESPEYWVCVRPALGMAGKEDTHWVTLSALPEKNVWTYQGKTKDITFKLPTNLGKSYEQMQNLAEMLYAICNPQQWWDNLQGNAKLPLFHDLYHIRAPYFNQYFWQMVQENWKDEIFGAGSSVCEKVMGRTLDNLKTIINDNNALNLLYSGYSWNTTFSNSPTLYQYTYSNGAGNAANMHKAEYKKISKNVMSGVGIPLNCIAQIQDNSWENEAFFGDNQPRFIFRFATGKELLGSTPSVYASIATVDERIKNVYVFNDIQDVPVGPQTEPKIYTEADATGTQTLKNKTLAADPVYLPGDVLMDEEGARWFCIHTSNNSSMTSQCRDSLAWFVSFEGVETSEDDKVATNILTEEDLPFFAYYWARFYSSAANTKPNKEYKPLDLETNQLGDLGEHIKKYADIDIRDIVLQRDSTWRFYSKGKWYDSPSTGNRFWNIAYSDGRTDRQPVARMIFDYTQAGNSRGDCYGSDGKKYMDFFWRLYKHYETYDPARITLNQVQKDFGMTEWNGTWPITSRLIFLQDLSDDLQVRGHAYPDKWTRLGYYEDGSHIDKATERTTVETDCKVSDYVLSKDQRTPRKGMWNEPVLIVRLMKVKDNGGNVPNLTSTDGRKLRVVHLRDSEAIYKVRPHVSDILGIPTHTSLCFFLDNQLYKLPKIPGLEQFYTE